MSLQSLNQRANNALQEKVAEPLNALGRKLEQVINSQLELKWTSPKTKRGLASALSAMESIKATIKVTTTADTTPAQAGTKTDALSLGVGISASAAAKLQLGLGLGIGFSASLAIGVQLVASIHGAIAGVSNLNRALVSYNASAKTKAGFKGTLAPGVKLDETDVTKALRSLNDKLSDCQSKADAATGGKDVDPIEAELDHPRIGAWECSLDVDAEVKQTGKIKFKLDDLEFVGTVLPDCTGMDGVRAKCRIVGGNGHLSNGIGGHAYSGATGVQVGTIVRDILKECGESLSDLSDAETLDKTLPRWTVCAGTAQQALTALAVEIDGAWRVLRDGSVWFGTETWPEVEPEGTLVNEHWSSGHLVLAAETPNMVPGTTYQGQKIEHVTHKYGTTLRTHIRTQTGSAVAALSELFQNKRHIDFSREYPCKVVMQNPDGTLQLLPDDEIMQARGLDHVPIRYGMPGMKARISNGARCHLAFAAGDPSRPFVGSWEHDPAKVELLTVMDGLQGLSGVGALVQSGGPGTVVTLMPLLPTPGAGLPPNNAIGAGVPCLITFSEIPLTPATAQLAVPLFGTISTGAPKFQG